MHNILRIFFKITVLGFLGGIFLFTPTAEATSPSDYLEVSNLNKYYVERLQSQSRIISSDLEYVREAIVKFDNTEVVAKFNKIMERVAKLRSAAKRCRERLASKELDVCTVTFRGNNISIDEAQVRANELESRDNLYRKCKDEAVMDERELSKRLREIDVISKDLEAWKRDNDEAIKGQIKTIAEFTFGQMVSYFVKQAQAAGVLKGWISRYEKQLVKEGVDVDKVLQKLEGVYSRYSAAQITASTGKFLEKTDPLAMYSILKNTASELVLADSEVYTEVKIVLDDPRIQKYLQKDRPAWEAADAALQLGANKILKKILDANKSKVPVVGLTILIRDTGYNGLRWWESLKRITERYDLSEKSAKAVSSLHNLIERRKANWDRCLKD